MESVSKYFMEYLSKHISTMAFTSAFISITNKLQLLQYRSRRGSGILGGPCTYFRIEIGRLGAEALPIGSIISEWGVVSALRETILVWNYL